MRLYKPTDRTGKTRRGCQWEPNITHDEASGNGLYYAYTDSLLAVLMNPVHGNFRHLILWEAKGEPKKTWPDKVGCKSLTTIRKIDLPEVTIEQWVTFGILAALQVCRTDSFAKWAKGWLIKEGRSADTACAIADATFATCPSSYAAAFAAAGMLFAPFITIHASACAAIYAAHANNDLDLVTIAYQAIKKSPGGLV